MTSAVGSIRHRTQPERGGGSRGPLCSVLNDTINTVFLTVSHAPGNTQRKSLTLPRFAAANRCRRRCEGQTEGEGPRQGRRQVQGQREEQEAGNKAPVGYMMTELQ